jgi:hypothetical protein
MWRLVLLSVSFLDVRAITPLTDGVFFVFFCRELYPSLSVAKKWVLALHSTPPRKKSNLIHVKNV